jgi:hypothetical protein
MARHKKIALIGARGYSVQSAEVRVLSYPWDRLEEIANLSDFDTVILDLLSVPSDIDWNRFTEILNIHTMDDIVRVGGAILVIGDPRFGITGENLDEPFLNWTMARFNWDEQPGDTIEMPPAWDQKAYSVYLGNLKHWDYALRSCALDQEGVARLFDTEVLEKRGKRINLERHTFAWNRYREHLAFSINIVIEKRSWRASNEWWEPEARYGTITFLPKISVNEDETLVIVLRDICGVEAGVPEPEWVAAYEAPGQDKIDVEIAEIKSRIDAARDELKVAIEERTSARECLKLLCGLFCVSLGPRSKIPQNRGRRTVG